MSIEQISGRIVDGLLIITLLTALLLVVIAGRRRRITIAEVSNATGRSELDGAMKDASADFRLAVGGELDRVREMVLYYHHKVRHAPDRCYGLELPEMNDALLDQQDSTLVSLLSSLEETPARGAAAQLQALGQLVVRSRGATVTATLHRPDRRNDRLGVAVEVVSPGSRYARHRLLREAGHTGSRLPPAERIDALLQAAARCAAIDLATWVLQRPKTLDFLRGSRREGLACNTAGLLMKASTTAFRPFRAHFLQFAIDEFKSASEKLPADYQPHLNLAGAREAAADAAGDSRGRYRCSMAAVSEYRAASSAAGRLPEPTRAAIRRTISVRLARAELVSGIPRLQQEALRWLREQHLNVALDCHLTHRRWPARLIRPAGIELDELTADYLYNGACLYAIAAGITGRPDWDRHARRLLGTALVIDAGGADLWLQARSDPDLRQLSPHLPEFLAVLRKALPDCPAGEVPLPEIVQLVDDVGAAAGWHAAPSLGAAG